MDQEHWWRDAVVYEIYPRSFGDVDGNGVGDLHGIVEHLPYVASLGVDAVWITPFQRSPQSDNGYDVSNYRDVDPLFGDLAAFDRLCERAHGLALRVVIDLVPNHCSAAHPLFVEALAAPPGSSERARFHFLPGIGPNGDEPPNNWHSVFGGSAWTRVTEADGTPGEWYLHLFAPDQPDWNWRDPRTAELFDDVMRFWFDRGVDGLRVDVAHALVKAEGLPDLDRDLPPGYMRLRKNPLACDQEEVHDIYRQWRKVAESYDPPRLLIGEVSLKPERAARFIRPDELHQEFATGFFDAPWDAAEWATIGTALLDNRVAGGGPVTWVTETHDLRRTPSRYAALDDDPECPIRGTARARAALLAVLGLPGGAYLYQGQELGLPDVDVAEEARVDPAWVRGGKSRDGARIPFPWRMSASGTHGFSPSDDADEPWLPVPIGWGALSVQVQETDPDSTLNLCRAALLLRRRLHLAGLLDTDDAVRWQVDPDGRLLAQRGAFVLVVAMDDEAVPLPPGDVLLASAPLEDGMLPPDCAAWVSDPTDA